MSNIYNGTNNSLTLGGDLLIQRISANTVSLGAGDSWAVDSIGWSAIDKTNSSLADLATRAYSDLTGRPGDDDFNTLTAETTADDADSILIYDDSAAAYRKMTRSNFVSGIGGNDDDQVDTIVAVGETFTVKTDYQHIVFEELTVDGEYIVNGESVILGPSTSGSHADNTNNPHATDVGNLGSGTLAELNAAITDATLDDSSSSRVPTTHASSHVSGGGDALKLDDLAAPDDNTDLNASVSAHGLLPKLPGGTTLFLRGDGSWSSIGVTTPNIIQVERQASWAATNFSSPTAVPFDTKTIEGDTGVNTWSSGDATKIEFGVSGDFLVTAVAQLVSTTSGATYDLQGWLRKNGSTELPSSRIRIANWEAEHTPIVIASYAYSFLDTDYLEFVLDHTSLTGSVTYCRITVVKLY